MFINDYGQRIPSKADNAADVITMTDVGGIGTLIYHTFRFKDYEYDYLPDDTLVLKPLVYKGYEPDVDKSNALNGSELFSELYNLGEKINDFSEKKSFDELIIEFCKDVAHPYDIDTVYEILVNSKLTVERHGNMISDEALKSFASVKEIMTETMSEIKHGGSLRRLRRYIKESEAIPMTFINEKHRLAFDEALTRLNQYDKKNTALMSALFLLTADYRLWFQTKRFVENHSISFVQGFVPRHQAHHHKRPCRQ